MKYLALCFLLCASLRAEEVSEEKPFVVSDIHYQLGNQLFEIAAALSLAWDHGAEAYFPDLQNVPWWNIPLNRDKVFFRLNANPPPFPVECVYQEPHFAYSPIPFHKNMRLHGYFQSENYFKHHRKEILDVFAPSEEILSYLQNKYADLLSHPCSVAVHVRTFYHDQVGNAWQYDHQPFVGLEYLENAIALFPEDALFIVCSDHIEWCKRTFDPIPRNLVFIEGNQHYHDLYLMSLCQHNIISNSSFSWWAAWLNQHPDKIVVAPGTWVGPRTGLNTKDLIPKEWIVLPSQSSNRVPEF